MKNIRKLSKTIYRLFFVLVFLPLSLAAQDTLPLDLSKAIKKNGFSNNGIGLFIQSVNDKQTIVSYHAKQALNPASVIKLVTTAAALGILGSGYRWSTDVSYTGSIKEATITGDLYFKGNGDPYLTPERFWRLLNRIAIYGVTDIQGNVYFDNSYFDPGQINYASFDSQPYRTYNVGPNALLIGFQATEFHFSHSNNKVSITAFPSSPKLHIKNNVKLSKGRCGSWQKRLNISTQTVATELQIKFTGRYAKACDKKTLYRRVTETQDHFRHYFLPLWRQIGGSISGQILARKMEVNSNPILSDESISLSEAIRYINKFSNNVMTRQLLLSMGAQQLGIPGTTTKGIIAVNNWLDQQGLDHSSLQFDNGAGLSRKTRVSAEFLGTLLLYVFQQPYMPEFISSLPVSGYDGTMANRFKGQALQGRTHIKTGLLDFVQSMAGYVMAKNGKRYVVVLLHNHPKAHTKSATRLQNDIIRWVYEL
ncbi:MAG: D-alanyl-D-alanine carboxypeptidase/D-alanyl-D-alanine-endopeptidase [Thiohalomonadales bacterium]